jgi:NADH dehydrogenase
VQLRLASSAGLAQEHFEPGQVVFRQGELGDRIYIVLSGEAEVVREAEGRETVLARLRAGEYFGEMALLNSTPRTATVRCAVAMDALSIPKHEFNALAANLPELREAFAAVAARRSAELPAASERAGA